MLHETAGGAWDAVERSNMVLICMCACACLNACMHVRVCAMSWKNPSVISFFFEFLSVGTTYFKSQLMWLRRGLSSLTDNKAYSAHDRSIPEPQRYCPTEVISLWYTYYMSIPPFEASLIT